MQMNPYQTYQQAPTMTYNPGFNAYQYNPMQNVQQRLPQEQMQPQQAQQPAPMSGMVGKMVGRIEDIAPQDVPMTGAPAFFPKQDLSEIYVKAWNSNGTLDTVVFKPVPMTDGINPMDGGKKLEIGLSDDVTGAFMKRFDELESKISSIESSLTKNTAKSTRSSTKKESDAE